MSDCIAEKIKFGFKVNYLCHGCGEQINAYYHWLSFCSIKLKSKYNIIKCPLCMNEVEVEFSLCDRPFPDCSFTIRNYESSLYGIGSMEIDNTFIVK
jgi:hypothetical protein